MIKMSDEKILDSLFGIANSINAVKNVDYRISEQLREAEIAVHEAIQNIKRGRD